MSPHKKPLSLRDLPTVRQLRAFSVVYETGNASAAAEILSLTQPAITVLLRELETKLGVRLFDRGPRGLHRTEAASEAILYAQRVLGDLHEMRKSMEAIASGRRGVLRIAATSAVAQTLLPSLIQRFNAISPDVRIIVDDCAPAEFIDRITSERVHLGIGTLEAAVAGLAQQVFMKDWLYAVADKKLLASTGSTITWKQMAALPIITVKPGYGVRRSIDHAADSAGINLNIIQEVSLLSTALAMAAQGLGVAIIPGPLPNTPQYAFLQVRRLIRPLVVRDMSVIYRSDRPLSPPAREFVKILGEVPKSE